jgi:beta-N-acetylhexosaminidase
MDAVAAYAQDGSVAVLAVLAGNDMLISSDYQNQIPQVLAAVEDGTIPLDTLDTACARVLRAKIQLGLIGE